MSLPPLLQRLSIPVIGSPLFIISNPDLVIAQCKAGVVGAFPALNARPPELLDAWLTRITRELAEHDAAGGPPAAPFAVNQIVHSSNDRLQHDIDLCEKYKVPIQITSLRAPDEVVKSAKRYGGLVFHDVTNVAHAKRALQAGVDGLILVCAGAGGHAGRLSPFALVPEVRQFYDGCLLLSGSIANGASVLAAQAVGADLAYLGTRFIASQESLAKPGYKEMITRSGAADLLYTPNPTGVPANWLKDSLRQFGLDPDNLPERAAPRGTDHYPSGVRSWRDFWSAGQGIELIEDVPPVAQICSRLRREYLAACAVPEDFAEAARLAEQAFVASTLD